MWDIQIQQVREHPLQRYAGGGSKSRRSRLYRFCTWQLTTQDPWYRPDLAQWRDHLLHHEGLQATTTRGYLSTVRAAYHHLLRSNEARQWLYNQLPVDLAPERQLAIMTEFETRLKNAIDPQNAPVATVTIQDHADNSQQWLTPAKVAALVLTPGVDTLKGLRDTAMIALMLCTGVRAHELLDLNVDDLQVMFGSTLALRVVSGKGDKQRLVPYGAQDWGLTLTQTWLDKAGITSGAVFVGMRKGDNFYCDPEGRPIRLSERSLDRSSYLTVGSDDTPESLVTLYPDMVVIEPIRGPGPQVGGGERGEVKGKSRSSRRRQMQLMAQIRPEGRLYLLSLTYSDDLVLDWEIWKRDLDVFGKRLIRRWPTAWLMWALDFQERKSGERVIRDEDDNIIEGQLAPHFHLIVGGINPADLGAEWFDTHLTENDKDKSELELRLQGWAKQNWFELNHVHDPAAVRRGADVVELDSRRKIYSYVAKYTGKEQDGLVHDIETGDVVLTGRMWGQRGDVPVHPGKVCKASEGEIVNLKRLIKRWLKARGQKSGQWYGKWVVRHSTGKKVVLFGWGLDAFNGLSPPETDDYVQPDKQADLDAFRRFIEILDMCGDAHNASDYAAYVHDVQWTLEAYEVA